MYAPPFINLEIVILDAGLHEGQNVTLIICKTKIE